LKKGPFFAIEEKNKFCFKQELLYHIRMSHPFFASLVGGLTRLPINIFDILFVIFLILYCIEEASVGFVTALFDFISIILSFLIAITFYIFVSGVITQTFSLTKGLSDALSFLLLAFIAWTVCRVASHFIKKMLSPLLLPRVADLFISVFFAVLSYLFLASFLFSLLLSFPVSKTIKNSLNQSRAATFLTLHTGVFETNVRKIFGGAAEDILNFLTVEPQSDTSVALHFTVQNPSVDKQSEKKMLDDVNKQRTKQGLAALEIDDSLTAVARAHGKDMLARGYFSHYTPEGYSPFDRMESAGISYTAAGENLAFAPNESIAMEGLMKSKGHRANILSPAFKRVGIGVLDAGVYGEVFVQEFTD
jgi:uncharacterized protein YkwD